MSLPEEVSCRGRIVPAMRGDGVVLRTEDGCLPIECALESVRFQAGDLVEVRLIERCPQWGLSQWTATARRG